MSEKVETLVIQEFEGNELAAKVWADKYKKGNDILPSDTIERFLTAVLDNEAKYEHVGKDKIHLLSEFGQKTGNHLILHQLDDYIDGFKGIFGQGSILASVGVKDTNCSMSNCWVIDSPHDSYSGIMKTREEMVHLMKRRGGVGFDLSTIRPRGIVVNNSARSSTGAASFMEATSALVREVAQEGRRGALMLTINILHPDALEFIKIKQDLTKVTGANISVFIPDEFMKAAEKDEDIIQRWPLDLNVKGIVKKKLDDDSLTQYSDGYIKKVKASDLLDAVVECAWSTGEPGTLFENRHKNYSPDGVYKNHKGTSTNPCGEQFLPPYDSCRLFILNLLFGLLDNKPDFEKFYEAFYMQVRVADSMVDVELQYILDIIVKIMGDAKEVDDKQLYNTELQMWKKAYDKAKAGRRIGCGFTALGDLIALCNLKYDSDEAMLMVEKLMKVKLQAELDATIDLAILRGPFEDWDNSLEFATDDVDDPYNLGRNDFYQFILDKFPEQAKKMQQYGRRNINWSTVAPTGSMSILAGTTSGLEPMFSPYYGRYVKITDSMSKDIVVARTDEQGDKWYYSAVIDHQFKLWLQSQDVDTNNVTEESLDEWFKKSPWFGSTANEIDWTKRVALQSIIQKYTTNSISSTLNLPREATVDDVRIIYLESWKKGLKGVTVYRDGCRDGVLVSSKKVEEGFSQKDAFKRPEFTTAKVHHNVLVGEINGKPYEVFYDNELQLNVAEYLDGFNIEKYTSGSYSVVCKNDERHYIETDHEDEYTDSITRMVSMELRHGVHPKFIVEQLLKVTGLAMTPAKAIAKALAYYIDDKEMTSMKVDMSDICPNDQESCLPVFEEGCLKCRTCGHSKC